MSHIVPIKTNLITLGSLVCLTVVTVLTAKFVDLGEYNLLLAMAIASVKAFIVLNWFMHLKYDGLMNRTIAVCGVGFLLLFFGISFLDMLSR
jgi:cytochrome c oxidase subunit 4